MVTLMRGKLSMGQQQMQITVRVLTALECDFLIRLVAIRMYLCQQRAPSLHTRRRMWNC